MAVQQQIQFQPRLSSIQTRQVIDGYKRNPSRYNEELLEDLRQHAYYHNIPFYEGDFSIIDAVKQAGGGFIEGFTTLKVVDPPDNEYEAIARNIGHLAGFAPGMLAGPAKALKLTGMAKAAGFLADKSVPMAAAKFATDKARGLVGGLVKASQGSRFQAANAASKFLLGNRAKHIAEGAFHLGVASSVSSVWEGVDVMLESFFGGAIAGGVFRGIGNLIPGDKGADKFVRGLAGSLFMGIPASQRGATTPEQVYEYLMGAYFGSKEMPWFRARAGKFLSKMEEQARKDPKIAVERNPEDMEGFSELPEIVQKHVKKQAEQIYGNWADNAGRAHELMKELGILEQIPADAPMEMGYPILQKVVEGVRGQSGTKPSEILDFGVSGGAKGADATWATYLKRAGVPTVHYISQGQSGRLTKDRTAGVPREMSKKELLNNLEEVDRAASNLNKQTPSDDYTLDLQLRNAEIVKKSSKIYAVGTIMSPSSSNKHTKKNPQLHGRAVEGGTGWGVQMAINARKPIFVFDQPSKKWFAFDYGVKGGGRFRVMEGIPNLVKRPGLIGTRKLTKAGKKAIKDVVVKKFPEAYKGQKPDESQKGINADILDKHPEVIKESIQLAERQRELTKNITELENAIKDKEIDKKNIAKAKKEIKANKAEFKKNDKRLTKLNKLSPTQHFDIEGNVVDESAPSVDTGMTNANIGNKAEYFVRSFMRDLYKGDELPQTQNARIANVSKQIHQLFIKHFDKNFKINNSEEFAADIQKIWPRDLSREAKGYLRAWLRSSNNGKSNTYLMVSDKRIRLTNPNNPRTYAGKRKKVQRAPSVLELFYEANRPKDDIGEPIVLFDEITVKNKRGSNIDVPLYKLKKHWANEKIGPKNIRRGEKKAETKFRALQSKIINYMFKNHNMVPLGGVGDKARMMFVKVHPNANLKPAKIKAEVATIRNEINKFKYKDKNGKIKKLDKDVIKKYKADKEQYKKLFGDKAGKEFDRIFYSNVLYDMSLNGFKVPKNKTEFRQVFRKLLNPEQFVGSAVAYNKRAQIWFNSFHGGNKDFMKNYKGADGKDLGLDVDGNFKYVLIGDPTKPKNKTSLEALNVELPEHVDGAIIARSDVVDAILRDAGLPESGQNKSFIVSKNPELGALLGKYMIHDAGKTATQQMQKQGLHFMIMTSAAKQTGNRKVTDYRVADNGDLTFKKGTETYGLNPEEIFYSPSTFGQKHMTQNQSWVKQLFTNFQQFGHAGVSKEVINDIANTIIKGSAEGTKEGNAILKKYADTLDDKYIKDIMNNIDKIGTQQLLEVSKRPGAERFAESLLQHMLRVNIEAVNSAVREGEVTVEQGEQFKENVRDFNSVADRILAISAENSKEANNKGQNGYSAYFHKFVRDYRMATMHNWVTHKITRPKVDNSAVGFIRPYDKFMQRKFPELNKRDDIFYLDNAYKETVINLAYPIKNRNNMKLGELWDTFNKKKNSGEWKKGDKLYDYVQDIFDAVVLRVPMDSASGAHKLRFKGFTDRVGHGIMMHSRSMRALGGADLDGDEAFFYFGGRTEDGKGAGMKKSWKEAIHAQKEEFYTGKGNKRDVQDNKKAIIKVGPDKGKTFSEVFTIPGGEDLKRSKTLFYSPMSRLNASQGAVEGRDMLGIAVSQGQIMKSTYNTIMDTPGKQDVFEVQSGFGKKAKTYRLTLKPRTAKEWQELQREMTRAQIAFASDPLDEAGLKGAEVFFRKLHEAHFELAKVEEKVGNKYFKRNMKLKDFKPWQLKSGIYGKIYKLNSANFGRSWSEGRNWTFDERHSMNRNIYDFSTEQINTMLPKMAETLVGIDYSENLFKRLDKRKIEQMYADMEVYAKELGWLKDAMQRSSFRVPYNAEVKRVLDNTLWDSTIRENIAARRFVKSEWDSLLKGTEYGMRLNEKSFVKRLRQSPEERKIVLNEVVKNAEDFILNDFVDMSSILNAVKYIKKHNISDKKVSELHETAESFKKQSYMDRKERRDSQYIEVPETREEIENAEINATIKEMFRRMGIISPEIKKEIEKREMAKGDKASALLDQAQLDEKISLFKENLSAGEAKLFDHFMIGSLNRGRKAMIQKYYNMIPEGKKDPIISDLYRKFMRDAAKTQMHRVGFNSEAVSDQSIKEHLSIMNDVFGKVWKKPTNSEKIANEVDKLMETKKIEMANGKEEEGYLGTKYLVDEMVESASRNEGYAGIKKGNVTKEDKAVITELVSNLKSLNDKVGSNLNEVLRGITEELTGRGKDLNAFNKQDFIMVNNYLRDIKTGNFFQRIWGTKDPILQKRHYWQFPEAVNRELMKHDIKWLKTEGYFVTKDGSVKKGTVRRPTYFLEVLKNQIEKAGQLSTSKAEEMIRENGEDFLFLDNLKEGTDLFKIANAQRENNGMAKYINATDKSTSQKQREIRIYRKNKEAAEKDGNWESIKDKKYTVTNDDGSRIQLTGWEIVNGNDIKGFRGIKRRINERFGKLHKMIVGNRDWMSKQGYITGSWDAEGTQPRIRYRKFINDVYKMFEKGDEAGMIKLMENVGIDGMRHIARSMMVDQVPKAHRAKYMNFKIFDTGKIDFATYWPHMFFSKSKARESLKHAIKRINDDPNLTKEEKTAEIKNIAHRHKALTGDWEFQDMQEWDRVDVLTYKESLKNISEAEKSKRQKMNWYDANQQMGSMMSRKGHIEGWANDISVMDAYMRNLSNTFFRQLQQVMSRDVINEAYNRMNKKFGKELAGKWNTYFKLYAQGAMGNPEIIPEEVYNDPAMKIKGTPYAWWADNRVLDRVNNIADKLGVKRKDLPKELQKFGYKDIRDWSNMEAKFELASLLAHPKSSVTNIFGGSMHTIESVGFNAFKKARDIKFLKRINPEFNTLKDVERWIIGKGVLPEFLVHELGLKKDFQKQNVKEFVADIAKRFQSTDEVKRKDIRAAAAEYNIPDRIVNSASKFMSIPERVLRRDAFMSHYIRAWERFGGAINDPNHPFLIEMARKGVKATQFLYDAPNRPMFARSALGKVMTRFQLFAWNSVRFRNAVLKEARLRGFRGEAADRFARMMQIDLFVLGLGNIFMYSLFDNALPPPYNWLQDTSDWLFGDEKERNKAFFGALPTAIAPLQTVMPPIGRLPASAIQQWVRDDYSKFTDYNVWTLFPYGRMARDIMHERNGLINNPTQIVEKVTGLPVHDLGRKMRKQKEAKEEGTYVTTPKPGFKYGK